MPLDSAGYIEHKARVADYDPATALLREGRKYVLLGWCQNTLARNKYGVNCDIHDPHVVEWCAVGAISRAGVDLGFSGIGEANARLNYVAMQLGFAGGVVPYNNYPGRTKEEVVALFDRAIVSF